MKNSNLAMLAPLNGNISGGVVQESYGGHSETPQTLNFLLFALLTSSLGVTWSYLGGVKVSDTHHDGNMFCF